MRIIALNPYVFNASLSPLSPIIIKIREVERGMKNIIVRVQVSQSLEAVVLIDIHRIHRSSLFSIVSVSSFVFLPFSFLFPPPPPPPFVPPFQPGFDATFLYSYFPRRGPTTVASPVPVLLLCRGEEGGRDGPSRRFHKRFISSRRDKVW